MKKIFLYSIIYLSLFLGFSNQTIWAQGADCLNAEPFCDNVLNPFSAGINQPDAPVGNNYDCLFTQPNPAWYTMTIGQSGDIDFTLDNTNNVDIDFILWGPFASIADANAGCGNLGNGGVGGNVIDCSYSAVAQEDVFIPNAVAGEVYVLLITNYSNLQTDIFSTTNTGDGSIVCDCGVNYTYDLLPTGLNDGLMIDTTGASATFVVCPPDPIAVTSYTLGFNIGVGGQNAADTIAFFNSDVSTVFPNSLVFAPAPSAPFDTNDVLIQVTPDNGNIGFNQFSVGVLNNSANGGCIQNFSVSVLVPGIEASADDTVLCPMIADTAQLFGVTYADSFNLQAQNFQWNLVSGTATFSDDTLQNPLLYVPNTLMPGDSVVVAVEYSVDLPGSGTTCLHSDTVKFTVSDISISATAQSPICAGESALIEAEFLTNNLGGLGSGCGLNTTGCVGSSSSHTVGTGVGISTNSTPYNGFYEDRRVQYLYLASELQAQGIQAGLINRLGFEVLLPGSTIPFTDFRIKMGCTNISDFVGATDFVPSLSEVYLAPVPVTPNIGLNTYNFDTPYEWDGVSNIVVEVCFNNTDWDGNDEVLSTITTFQSVLATAADGISADCGLDGSHFSFFASPDRPNTTFFNCAVEAPIDYVWTPTTGFQPGETTLDSVYVSPITPTTYYVSATDGYCSLDDSVFVDVQSSLAAPTINCSGGGAGSVTFNWAAIPQATEYEYSTDGGLTWTTTTNTTATISTTGAVTILVRGVNVNAAVCPTGLPDSLTCTPSIPCDFQFNVISFNNTACVGATPNGYVVVEVTNGNAPFAFELNGMVDTITGTTDTIFTDLSAISDTIFGTEVGTGCTSFAVFTVQDQTNSVTLSAAQTATIPCNGADIAAIEATATGSGTVAFLWSTGDTSSTIQNIGAGTYTVSASVGGCIATETIVIDAPFNPSLNAIATSSDGSSSGDSISIFQGDGASLDAGANETGVTYQWVSNPQVFINNDIDPTTSTTPDQSGTIVYTITASADTCIVTDQVIIEVVPTGFKGMPTAFTPNADGTNDYYRPVDLIGADISSFQIFNRWGQKVYDNPTIDPSSNTDGWDGTFQGQQQARGAYIYVVGYSFPGDAEVTYVRGEFMLLR